MSWNPDSGVVDANRSDAIEYERTVLTPAGFLGGGRLYVQPQKLVFVGKVPHFVPRDERVLALYDALRSFVKSRFHFHKTKTGGVYVGPDALEWHRQGGRIRSTGAYEDDVVDFSRIREERH